MAAEYLSSLEGTPRCQNESVHFPPRAPGAPVPEASRVGADEVRWGVLTEATDSLDPISFLICPVT